LGKLFITPFFYLYDLYRNLGVVKLDKDAIQIDRKPTIEDILNRNTDISLEIRDGLNTSNDRIQLLQDQLTTLQNQGFNVNPQFNVLIQQYITRINEAQEDLNRAVTESTGRSAALTEQVLRKLKDNVDSLDRNTREVANLVEASRAGSAFGTSTTSRRGENVSPLTTPPETPLREDVFE
jgi:archaellum component FlaC